jgi:hypothetical protein
MLFPGSDLAYASATLCKPGSCPQSVPQINGFIEHQYNNAAKEIQERIQFEHLLFALKFTAAGVIIAFVAQHYRNKADVGSEIHQLAGVDERAFIRSRGPALCCWIAVVVCQTIDVHLQSNIRILSDIGTWVRECVEPCLKDRSLVGWETYFSALGPHRGPLSWFLNLERHLFTFVLFALTVLVFVYFPKKVAYVSEVEAEALLRVAGRMLPLSIVLFGWTGLYFYAGIRWVNYGYVAVVFLFIGVTMWCLTRLSKLEMREPEAEPVMTAPPH